MIQIKDKILGVLFALVIATIAFVLGKAVPLVGGPIFGIVLGIFIGNLLGKPKNTASGLKFTSKQVLQYAIVLLGAGLSFNKIIQVGVDSLYVMLFTLTGAFIAAYGFGRLMKTPFKLTSLIGMGTAICGGSAIAALSPIIEAEDQEIAYAISTVFFFNVVAVLIFPAMGHLMKFSDHAFGLWAGTAINDTSSVVASGYAYSNSAGNYATIVKLTRSTLIIPISVIFAVVISVSKRLKANKSAVNYSFSKIFPWFILWFLVASIFSSFKIIPNQSVPFLTESGKFLIIVALAAIGLNSDFKQMSKMGFKPVLLGMLVWIVVAIISLIVQFMSGLA